MGAIVAARRFQMLADIAFADNIQPFDDLERDLAAEGTHQRHMEGAVELADLSLIGIGGDIERFERDAGSLPVGVGGHLRGLANSVGFELEAQGVDFLDFIGPERLAKEAAIGV